MGRIQTTYTYEEIKAALGMPRHARLEVIDVDDVTRDVRFVWRSGHFIEVEEYDGHEPPVWPVEVLKADALHEKRVISNAAMQRVFEAADKVVQSVLDAKAGQPIVSVKVTNVAPISWTAEEPSDAGDAITTYGRERDRENGFDAAPRVEVAVCPVCSGGLLTRETATVRRIPGYREAVGADTPETFTGTVLRCLDCGHRQPTGAGLEVV